MGIHNALYGYYHSLHLLDLVMDRKAVAAGILFILVVLTSPGHCLPVGAPAAACDNLMPQHGSNINSTEDLPFELDADIEDPGIPTESGILSHTHSYTPGLSYNCMCYNKRTVFVLCIAMFPERQQK